MKLKENFKRFWTLSKNRKGFTLVELIVVIAILAILAGVAIPVYNGYIKKAQTAADQQLADSINTAYAAACLTEGVNQEEVVASVTIGADGLIINQQGEYNITITDAKGANADDIKSNFAMFFAGNETAAFKGDDFVNKTYALPITAGEGDDATYGAYSKLYAMLTGKDVSNIVGSIFMNKDAGLGVDVILGKVNEVTDVAASLSDVGGMAAVFNDPKFQTYAAETFGIDPTNEEQASAKMAELMAGMKEKYPDMSDAELENKLYANAAVLYAAENSSKMTVDSVVALLGSGNGKSTISGNLVSDSGTALSQAAVAYGMYTAYAYSTGDAEIIAGAKDPMEVMNKLNEKEFVDYINDSKNSGNIQGYIDALGLVGAASDDQDAVDSLMVNGFNDPALAGLIGDILGSK